MQLCFDFDRVASTPVPAPSTARMPAASRGLRRARGQMAYHAGHLAEASVADRYRDAGYDLVQSRWHGQGGEIDLILRKGGVFVFVEVKAARDFSRAAERISRRQMDRICMAACEFCDTLPNGLMTEMRMDAALVDQIGRIEIIENAFGEH
ncbi:MAG: YraN family protein [Paracoccus sp. (in: a-proteobacteria)]